MCWQCDVHKPEEYLSIFPGFSVLGWYWGEGSGYGVCEFVLEGKIYHTNPYVDPSNNAQSLPGDLSPDGEEIFLVGEWDHKHEMKG